MTFPGAKPGSKSLLRTLGGLVVVVLVVIARLSGGDESATSTPSSDAPAPAATSAADPVERATGAVRPAAPWPSGTQGGGRGVRDNPAPVASRQRSGRSGVMVEVPARVYRVLPDDDDGARHQRFLIRLSDDQSLLVAHNIDLAPRVPLDEGDSIVVHGQFESNDRGGVLHWTHHDPRRRREGGWIEFDGKRYE